MELLIDIEGMTEGVRTDLAEVREKRGRAPTAEEARELLRLAEGVGRAYRGRSPEERSRDGLLSRSVRVGDVTLRSLTIAGRLMLRRLVAWNSEDGALFDQETWDVLNAWVFAHSGDRAAMSLCLAGEVTEAALEWAAGLTCSTGELQAGLDALTAGAAPVTDDEGGADEADTVRALAAHVGGTPDHWLHDVPESQAAHVMDAANEAARRETAATAKAANRQPPPDADAKLRAIGRYSDCLLNMMGETPGDG